MLSKLQPAYNIFFFQKQDGKDTSIQKRLSWNYGQHIPNQELTLQQQQRLPGPQGRHSGGSKCLSSESMHSSSGVSSTGSLHLSIGSEWEDSTASTGTVVTATHIYRNLQSSKEDSGECCWCFIRNCGCDFSFPFYISLKKYQQLLK